MDIINGTLGTRAEKMRESRIRLRKGRWEGVGKVVKANQSTIYYKLYTFIFKLTFVNFVKKIILMSPNKICGIFNIFQRNNNFDNFVWLKFTKFTKGWNFFKITNEIISWIIDTVTF